MGYKQQFINRPKTMKYEIVVYLRALLQLIPQNISKLYNARISIFKNPAYKQTS